MPLAARERAPPAAAVFWCNTIQYSTVQSTGACTCPGQHSFLAAAAARPPQANSGVTAAYKAKFRNLHFNMKDEKNPDLRRKVRARHRQLTLLISILQSARGVGGGGVEGPRGRAGGRALCAPGGRAGRRAGQQAEALVSGVRRMPFLLAGGRPARGWTGAGQSQSFSRPGRPQRAPGARRRC